MSKIKELEFVQTNGATQCADEGTLSPRSPRYDLTRIRPASEPVTEDAYFAWKAAAGAPMKPLGKPCHDCAVVWGLYTEISDALANQPPEVIEAVSLRWFCHNHANRACRGNIDNIAAVRARAAQSSEEQPLGSSERRLAVAHAPRDTPKTPTEMEARKNR